MTLGGAPVLNRSDIACSVASGRGRRPLVGRSDELAEALRAVGTGTGGLVVVGAAGVGKTRFLQELTAVLIASEVEVSAVTATPSLTEVPYGAVASLLEPPDDDDRNAAARVLDGLAPRDDDQARVIVVDDGQHLDAATTSTLVELVRLGRAGVVVGLRSGAPPADLTALWKDGLAVRVDLPPLNRDDAARLLGEQLDGRVERSTVERLWTVSEGSPLYLRELVHEGSATGALEHDGDVWLWNGPIGVGRRVVDLIEERVSRATPDERDLLDLLALGEPIRLEVLAQLVDDSTLAAAERDGLVVADVTRTGTVVRSAHPLIAEAVRSGLGPLARRELAGRLVAASPVEDVAAADLLQVAVWHLASAERGRGDLLLRATRAAINLGNQPLAEELATAAIAAGGGYGARVFLAETLYWQGRFDEALRVFRECDVDGHRAESAIGQAAALYWGLGRTADAVDLLERAEAVLPRGGARDEVTAHRATIIVLGTWDQAAGRALADDVLARSESPEARLRAVAAAVLGGALMGSPQAVDAVSSEGLELAVSVDVALAAVGAVIAHCVMLLMSGRVTELDEFTALVQDSSAARETDDARGVFTFLRGRALLARGRVADATDALQEAAALLRRRDVGGILGWCLGALAEAAGQCGDARTADAAIAEADASGCPILAAFGDIELGRAWAFAAKGETSRAHRLAWAAAERCDAAGQRMVAVLALHDSMRIRSGGDVAERLAVLGGSVEGELGPACAAHGAALEADDGPALDECVVRFTALGCVLLAAEAAAEAASAHGRAGLTARRLTSLAESRRLAATCGGAATPALVGLAAPVEIERLTDREREVAQLAARGMSNREIADRLTLSVRTVGNHLYRIYMKLGVADRDRLRDWLDGIE